MPDILDHTTTRPLSEFLELISLAPETLGHAIAMLSFLFVCNYLLRTAYMTEHPRSVLTHMLVCTLTLLPAIALAGILVWAAYRHPDRAWINLGVAALLYLPWYLGGAMTRLARRDAEGGDLGWLTMGAVFITFPVGVIAALVATYA
jgi:hypothetical protein